MALILVILLIVLPCEKKAGIKKDCLKEVLKQKGMVEYRHQEIGCNSFLELYKFKQRQYFLINNHCADLLSYPFDCAGNKLCANKNTQDCQKFYETAEYVGIVGIQIN